MYENIYYPDYLMHHGVKGMKWGVRRYRNADGSLTDVGKRRQQKEERREQKKLVKKQKSWEQDVRKNWHKAYNNAANEVNRRIPEFNAKWKREFEGYSNWADSPKYRNYTKAYADMFNDIYVKELDSAFGKSPIDTGRKWVETVPMFLDADNF